MLRSLGAASLLLLVAVATPGAEAKSFRADLALAGARDRASAECMTSGPRPARLTCLLYGTTVPVRARCAFGGAVTTMTLLRRGRARRSYVCIDEAFHRQPRLRAGRRFRSGPFVCRHLSVRRAGKREGLLRCRRGSGPGFSLDARGRIRRL